MRHVRTISLGLVGLFFAASTVSAQFRMPVAVTAHRAALPKRPEPQAEQRSRTGQVIGSTVMGALLGAVVGYLAAAITVPDDAPDQGFSYAISSALGAGVGTIAGFFIGLRYNPGGSLQFATAKEER